jgi:hypothetical protein
MRSILDAPEAVKPKWKVAKTWATSFELIDVA